MVVAAAAAAAAAAAVEVVVVGLEIGCAASNVMVRRSRIWDTHFGSVFAQAIVDHLELVLRRLEIRAGNRQMEMKMVKSFTVVWRLHASGDGGSRSGGPETKPKAWRSGFHGAFRCLSAANLLEGRLQAVSLRLVERVLGIKPPP